MATNAKDRAREIVQERRDAYDRKVTVGAAIPDTFQFNIRHNGNTDHRINWSYPNSKWFGKQLLEKRLGDNYISIPELGGKNFTTHDYQKWHKKVSRKTLEELVKLSDQHIICLLCAEKDHLKCHRYYFVAKALKEDFGIEVKHL